MRIIDRNLDKNGCLINFQTAISVIKKGSVLFAGNIRCTHIADANITAISFFEKAHVVAGIKNIICRISKREITHFYHLVAIA